MRAEPAEVQASAADRDADRRERPGGGIGLSEVGRGDHEQLRELLRSGVVDGRHGCLPLGSKVAFSGQHSDTDSVG